MSNDIYLPLLEKLVSIQSVSTDPKRKKYMIEALKYLGSLLKPIGFKVEVATKKDGNPCIIALRETKGATKTLGF